MPTQPAPVHVETVEEAAAEFAKGIEASMHQHGWDKPGLFADIYWVEDDELTDMLRGQHVPDEPLIGFKLKEPEAYGDHPRNWLVGRTAPEEAVGVVYAHEVWTYPDEVIFGRETPDVSPSDHPGRVEARMVYVALRDGTVVSVMRRRDRDTIFVSDKNYGLIPAYLRRYLGALSGPLPHIPPTHVLAYKLMTAGFTRIANNQPIQDVESTDELLDMYTADAIAAGCLTLLMPHREQITYTTGLLSESWEGIADHVRMGCWALLNSIGEPVPDPIADWVRYAAWADDAILANDILDGRPDPYPTPRETLECFEAATRTVGGELVETVRLYRKALSQVVRWSEHGPDLT